MADMGKVMGILKSKYAGSMDKGKASGIIKENYLRGRFVKKIFYLLLVILLLPFPKLGGGKT